MSSCQLFKHLRRKFTIVNTIRHCSYDPTSITPPVKLLVPLKNRKLLKVSGKDAPNFLQGLITNDMRHFKENAKSMYAMFLNNKGRVLYDALIYKWENEQSFLVECDESISDALQKHLKLFKLKQAVSVEDMFRTLYLWALISPANGIPSVQVNINSPIRIYKDPRLIELGCRILTVPAMAAEDIIDFFGKENQVELGDEDIYKYLRYKLGVGEGAEELPPGLCYPLEANCDYLHGVSFHKGCYIGQELTARVHHTGVVRKRLMPIKFNKEVKEYLEKDTLIKLPGNPKSNLGKLKGYMHNYGLGLVRIKEAVEAECLSIGGFTAQVVKPDWWPLEAPKEKPLEAPMEKHLEETKGALVDAIEEKPIETIEENPVKIIKQSPLKDVNETLTTQSYQKLAENTAPIVGTNKIPMEDRDETPVAVTNENPMIDSDGAPILGTNEIPMEDKDEAPVTVTNEKPREDTNEKYILGGSNEKPIMVDSNKAPIVETNERLTKDSNEKLILRERNSKPIEDTSEKPLSFKIKDRLYKKSE